MYSSVLQNRGEPHPCLTLGKDDISAQMYVVKKKNTVNLGALHQSRHLLYTLYIERIAHRFRMCSCMIILRDIYLG